MCDLLKVLVIGLWDIFIRAMGIFIGTGLAYYAFVGPILRNNEKRKKDEEIIEQAIELLCKIGSQIDSVAQRKHVSEVALLDQRVSDFSKYVTGRIKSTIPDLASSMETSRGALVRIVSPQQQTEVIEDCEAEYETEANRIINEAPEIVARLGEILNERKIEGFRMLYVGPIRPAYEKLRNSTAWQNLTERFRGIFQ